MTDCGTSRSATSRWPVAFSSTGSTGASGPACARELKTLSIECREPVCIDGAHDRNLHPAARDQKPMHCDDVVAGDPLDALDRSGRRARVGVIGKSSLEELPRRHDAGIVLLITKPRDGLRTDAFYRVSVEARLGERKTKQFERFVGVFHQSLQRPADRVVPRVERKLDRMAGQAFLKRVGIVVARAFVEQSAQHLGDARLDQRDPARILPRT